MYKSRTFIIVIIAALLSASIIGLIISIVIHHNRTQTLAPQNITLNMVGYTYSNAQMTPLINEYEQLHKNITINYTQQDALTYKDYLIQRFHSGNSAIQPDIFEAKSTSQNDYLKYSQLAPLDLINATQFKNTYYPIYRRGLLYQDKYVLGLPENLDPVIVLYNNDLLQKYGYDPKTILASFDSFNAFAGNFAANQSSIASVAIGDPSNVTMAGDILQIFMLEDGVKMNDSTGKATFNTQQGKQALSYYAAFVTGDFADNWVLNSNLTDIEAFTNNKVALTFTYLDQLPNILAANPAMHIGYALYPTLLTPLTLANYDYLTVYAQSPNGRESWNFIQFLNQPQQLQTLSDTLLTKNAYGIVYPRTDTPIHLGNSQLTAVLSQSERIAVDWNTDGLTTTQTIFKNLLAGYLQGGDPQSLLDNAVSLVNKNIQNAFNL